MTPDTFNYLLGMIKNKIQRSDTVMRKAKDPQTRLCVTILHLATGANLRTLAFTYALGRKTVSDIIFDTCQAIWDILSPVYLKPLSTHAEWNRIAQQ